MSDIDTNPTPSISQPKSKKRTVIAAILLVVVLVVAMLVMHMQHSRASDKAVIDHATSEVMLPDTYKVKTSSYSNAMCFDVCAQDRIDYQSSDGQALDTQVVKDALIFAGYTEGSNHTYHKTVDGKSVSAVVTSHTNTPDQLRLTLTLGN